MKLLIGNYLKGNFYTYDRLLNDTIADLKKSINHAQSRQTRGKETQKETVGPTPLKEANLC